MRGSEFAAQFDNSIDNLGHPISHYAYGMGWGSASSGPLNRFKMTVSEGGIRVPLIMSGPGISKGNQFDGFAYVWDIMPTVLEYAGIQYPETFQSRQIEPLRGRSLTGVLNGSTQVHYGEDDLVGGEMGNGKWMRQGRYKAVSVAPPYGDGGWHLYDVVSDPGETSDLSAQWPEKLKQLQAAWDVYAQDVGVVLSK
jgi:arylsulfatase